MIAIIISLKIFWLGRKRKMKKLGLLGAGFLGGLLLIGGTGELASPALAQTGPGARTEKEWQELREKRLKEWDELEKEDQRLQNTPQRRQEAEKRQRDAEKRQREVERQLRELDK